MSTLEQQVRRQAVRLHDAPGATFIRHLSALALGEGKFTRAKRIAAELYPRDEVAEFFSRATAPISTTAGGGALTMPGTNEVINLIRGRTVAGRLGLRKVPFLNSSPVAVAEPAFGWVGEGKPVPAGRLTWEPASLPSRKLGGIVTMTAELLRLATPESEDVVREEVVGGAQKFLDSKFLSADPPVEGEAPGGIAHNAPATASSGNPLADVATLLGGFPDSDSVVLIGSLRTVAALAAAGLQSGMLGGALQVVASGSVGNRLVALDARRVLYASGGLDVTIGGHGSVEMESEPTSPATASTVYVPLWSSDMVAIRVLLFANWLPLEGSVRQITNVAY
jgi:hypothetical protein